MAIKRKGSNQLLLLAGTALVLCVAVLSNGNNSVADSLQGMVLSDRDEVKEVNEVEERNKETKESNERTREEEKKRIELKTEATKKKVEQTREEEKKRLEIKIREKKSSPEPTELKEQNREHEESRNQENNEVENDLEDENEFEIETDGVKATTDLPLKLNTKTNELSVTSKDGESVNVVILPDQAVENLVSNKKVEIVGETVLEENSETGEFEYKAKVVESKKLLGLFSIKLNKEYRVSSEDGDVQEVELTGFNRILNFISF